MNFEDEIDVLEDVLSNLESAILSVQDSPYHSYLAQSWELDKSEIESRLDKLHSKQSEQWRKEQRQEELDYERSVL